MNLRFELEYGNKIVYYTILLIYLLFLSACNFLLFVYLQAQSIQFMNIRLIINLTLILYLANTLNVAITKAKQTCFTVTLGRYQLQYVVSGSEENNARCVVQQNNKIVLQVRGKSEFQGQFEITQNQGSICFSSMDSHTKSVSFDFINMDDPLRGMIKDEQKLEVHESLFKSYQQLQKVYRDQHFFLQRHQIHQILLREAEMSVIFFLVLKLMTVFICGFLQFFYVKIILQNNYKPLSPEQSSGPTS